MPPLKFLHLHGTFQPGGKEARVVQLMNHWGDRVHHTVLVANIGDDKARAGLRPDIVADFPTDAPSLHGKPGPLRYWRLAQYMKSFDLVLSYNWGSMDGPSAHRLWSPVLRLPPIVHHEDGFNADEANGLKPIRNRWRRHALGSAKALVVPSQRLEGIALDIWKQPAKRVHRIDNGIDIDAYSRPPAPNALPDFQQTPGKLVVGTIAGLRPVKNLRRLVRAIAPLRDRLQLLVAGEGEERDAIAAEAIELDVELHLAGHQPNPARYIGLFDIFALSSDSEQFPISLVEAMAAGLPCASTDVGDVVSMLANDNRRFVVPVADEAGLTAALAQLADDPALRAKLGAANRAKAKAEFDQGAMIDAYARLYGNAMARPDILL